MQWWDDLWRLGGAASASEFCCTLKNPVMVGTSIWKIWKIWKINNGYKWLDMVGNGWKWLEMWFVF